jgi:hypothetical protein
VPSWFDEDPGKPDLEQRRQAFLVYTAIGLVILLVMCLAILFFGDCEAVLEHDGFEDMFGANDDNTCGR